MKGDTYLSNAYEKLYNNEEGNLHFEIAQDIASMSGMLKRS